MYDTEDKPIGSRDVTYPNPALEQLIGQYRDSVETQLTLQKDARDEIFRDEEAVRAFEDAQANRDVATANAITAATGGNPGGNINLLGKKLMAHQCMSGKEQA